ncbi:hypothetical protein KDK_04310 [Dictyobacter kobayashii]|uniref:Uncharacterized protein n=1 Tax=Dictyobacter kobayashii TaxID=2014872 RepID=A0A402AC20_9CHLR|nr:hypothetical protein KDK_04310 [Dictyobacter kobayashii]
MSAEDHVPEEDIAVPSVQGPGEGQRTEAEHQKERVASLLLRPGHTASCNILAVLTTSDLVEAFAVLRFPRSSLSINRNEHNNSIQ